MYSSLAFQAGGHKLQKFDSFLLKVAANDAKVILYFFSVSIYFPETFHDSDSVGYSLIYDFLVRLELTLASVSLR